MEPTLFDSVFVIVKAMSVPVSSAFISLGGIWLARTWITTRLTEAIKSEYTTKLQEHKRQQEEALQTQKNVLDAKLQAIRHENEVGQLRTSLFFDHQRDAFQAILTETSAAIQDWWGQYDQDTSIAGAVPSHRRHSVEVLIRSNSLFLDPECIFVLDILLQVYRSSMPFNDGGGPVNRPDGRKQLDDAEYLQPRIAAVFQRKIGVMHSQTALADIALFGISRFLQAYGYGADQDWAECFMHHSVDAEDAVAFAQENWEVLSVYLTSLQSRLRTEGWTAHQKYSRLTLLLQATNKLER